MKQEAVKDDAKETGRRVWNGAPSELSFVFEVQGVFALCSLTFC